MKNSIILIVAGAVILFSLPANSQEMFSRKSIENKTVTDYKKLQNEVEWDHYNSKKERKKRAKAEGKDKSEVSKEEKKEERFEEKLKKWRKEDDNQ